MNNPYPSPWSGRNSEPGEPTAFTLWYSVEFRAALRFEEGLEQLESDRRNLDIYERQTGSTIHVMRIRQELDEIEKRFKRYIQQRDGVEDEEEKPSRVPENFQKGYAIRLADLPPGGQVLFDGKYSKDKDTILALIKLRYDVDMFDSDFVDEFDVSMMTREEAYSLRLIDLDGWIDIKFEPQPWAKWVEFNEDKTKWRSKLRP